MQPARLTRPDGETLAYLAHPGQGPTIVWAGGFRSDMTGNKAAALAAWAQDRGHAYIRFDYFAHGQSSGDWAKATISRWREDCLAIINDCTAGPLILIGSSMGAWLATLAALARPDRVKGLLAIAPALDFTETLMQARMDAAARQDLEIKGVWMRPSAYGGAPYPITRLLLEDGRRHLLLGQPIALTLPVRILHGMKDTDVPWQHGLAFAERLEADDADFTLIKEGDHRLSTPRDLARLIHTVERLISDVAGASGPAA